MITVGFSTRKINPTFVEYIKNTIGPKNVEIIPIENDGVYSLTQAYNMILDQSSNDIVILCHDDIYFEKTYWGKRLLDHFNKNPEYGILGVAGTTYYPKSGRWWDIQGEMVGQVYHEHQGKKWLSQYNKPFGSKIIDTVIVDGLFLGVKKSNIKKKFNEEVQGFHFYDTTFCLENFLEGVKVGTISNIEITHKSIGMTNQEWERNRESFVKKFEDNLPIKLKSQYPKIELDTSKPIVSVIIPIYNYGIQFEKTLNSVYDSTYKNVEIIIVNDGSTDQYVLEKLKSLSDISNIKIINQENKGPSAARNRGVQESKGDYILPLDADDMIKPEYIESCLRILKKNPNVSPVYCDTHHIGEMHGIEKRPEWSEERLIQGPFIVNCSMFHRKAFEDCGGFDETLKGWEDYHFWLKMMKKGYKGVRIPKPLFVYFHHEKDGTISTQANINQQVLYQQIMEKINNFSNHEN
jgi:glycosyltransferase involved in cell wall biosynthesis